MKDKHQDRRFADTFSDDKLVIMWPDRSLTSGQDATDILEQLCGGWNPETIPELRRTLARRAAMTAPTDEETDREFLDRMVAKGVLKMYEVHPEEWSMPS